MDFELTDVQRAVRDTARTFASARVAPAARDNDRTGRFPEEVLHEMAGLGLLGVNVSEAYGGAASGAVAYALAMMEIAAACASTSVEMAVTNMAAEVIEQFGTEAQKRKHVQRLTSGQACCGAFALSEPHCGSDAAALRATATRVGDTWVLDGSKQWITGGDHAGVLIVWARLAGSPPGGAKGITAFVVEGGTPGLVIGRREDKAGLRASTTVGLTFDNCAVPAENLLGTAGDGFKIAMVALDGGRIGIASQACGVARAALAAAAQYAKGRSAFGQPIGELQAITFKLADMATEIAAAELMTLRAAYLKERGRPFTREASMAKVFASEVVQRVASQAVQIHGGEGYLDDFPVERYMRDARVTTIYEGTSEVQRVVIARETLRA